ncbi:MAG TPA: ferritin-like domain-containing protein [Actinomycetota bacterium]|nr:ferritin-like domain-containing protein [Actinomycetota bacterium]
MSELLLEDLDRDGAFREAMEKAFPMTRADFLRKAAIGGGALLAAVAAPGPTALSKQDDTSILNFDLTFEYMQAGFYTEAEMVGTVDAMGPDRARAAKVFGAHERAHVKILQGALGDAAVKKPFFDYQGVTESIEEFTRTMVAMEDLTTALLAGQTARIRSRGLVAAVFSLLTVEARHAAWVRHVAGVPVVGPAFDRPRSLRQVDEVVQATGFLGRRGTLRARGAPAFTG